MRLSVVLAAMLTWAAAASALAAQAASAPAQEAKAMKRDKGIPEHFEGIALSDEQKAKVRSAHNDFHTQMTAVKVTNKKKDNDGKTMPMTDKVKKQLAELESKEMAAFRAILTPEQVGSFDKNLAKEKEAEAAKAAAEKAKP